MKIIALSLGGLVDDGKVLLIRRIRPPFRGMWALPGGKIEFCEQIDECALREFHEETGIRADSAELRGIVSEVVHDEEMMHFLMFVHRLNCNGRQKPKESGEGSLRWFSSIDLEKERKNIVGSDYEMIKQMILKNDVHVGVYSSLITKKEGNYVLEHFMERKRGVRP